MSKNHILTVEVLENALSQFPSDWHVSSGDYGGGLAVFDDKREYVGVINFLDGTVVRFDLDEDKEDSRRFYRARSWTGQED